MMQGWGPKPFGHRKRTRPPTATTYKAIKVPNCLGFSVLTEGAEMLAGQPRRAELGCGKAARNGAREALGDGQNAHDFEALRDVSHPLLKTGAVTGNIRPERGAPPQPWRRLG